MKMIEFHMRNPFKRLAHTNSRMDDHHRVISEYFQLFPGLFSTRTGGCITGPIQIVSGLKISSGRLKTIEQRLKSSEPDINKHFGCIFEVDFVRHEFHPNYPPTLEVETKNLQFLNGSIHLRQQVE